MRIQVFFFLQPAHVIADLFGLVQQFFHFQQEIGPLRGQGQFLVGPFEQLQIELLFQLADGC